MKKSKNNNIIWVLVFSFTYLVLVYPMDRSYNAFFSLPKKCAENYPEKEILKLCCD